MVSSGSLFQAWDEPVKVLGVLRRRSINNNGKKTRHKYKKETWKAGRKPAGGLHIWRAWRKKTKHDGKKERNCKLDQIRVLSSIINICQNLDSFNLMVWISNMTQQLPNMDGSWLTHSVYTPKTWSWDWLLRRSSPAAGTLKPSNIFLILAASLGAEASWKKVNCWGPRGPKRSEGIWRHLKGSGDPGEVPHYGCWMTGLETWFMTFCFCSHDNKVRGIPLTEQPWLMSESNQIQWKTVCEHVKRLLYNNHQ